LARPDVPVFLRVAAVHQDLCLLPFPDVADIHQGEASLLDADRGVVHQVCFGMADAAPEGPRRQDLKVLAAEKLAAHALSRLADAVLDHLASVLSLERPAWDVLVERWAELLGAAAELVLYKPDAVQSAA
jgi:hypothetical protein